jgi:hypothetical protein
MSKQKFIEMHLYMTDSKFRETNSMKLLQEIVSSIPDISMRKIVEEMHLKINKGRPNWAKVILNFSNKMFIHLFYVGFKIF